jgi:hypothetical protein
MSERRAWSGEEKLYKIAPYFSRRYCEAVHFPEPIGQVMRITFFIVDYKNC